jgi:hypothetical protein
MTEHTPPRVNTERVRKGLKRKGMGFALVHSSRIGVKKSEPFAAPFEAPFLRQDKQGGQGKKDRGGRDGT